MGFELILLGLTATTGLVALARFLVPRLKDNKIAKEISSYFSILLIVFIIRAFIAEPFRIPSSSMKPLLLEGDFILVDKFSHGFRMPISSTRITKALPERGDIVVFRGEVQGKKAYVIKRIIGIPGDKIRYLNKQLYLNDKLQGKTLLNEYDVDNDISGQKLPAVRFQETLDIEAGLTKKYEIFNYDFVANKPYAYQDVTVPAGKYFVMGNNRDNSNDSRYWGFLDDQDIVGKARLIWFSLDPGWKTRFDRVSIID